MAEPKVNLDEVLKHFDATLKDHTASIATINTNLDTFRLQLRETDDKAVQQHTSLLVELSTQRADTAQQLESIKQDHATFVSNAEKQNSDLTQNMRDLHTGLRDLTTHLTSSLAPAQDAPRTTSTPATGPEATSTPHDGSHPILSLSVPYTTTDPSAPTTNTVVVSSTAPPPTFSGKASQHPRQFLLLLEQHAHTVNHWSQSTLLQGVSQFLKDDALQWYCQLHHSVDMPQTWDDFAERFLNQFHSPLRAAQQKEEWVTCKQEQDETINHFSVRLRTLFDEQKPTETDDDFKQQLFIKMRPDMLALLSFARSFPLRKVMLEAQKLEELFFARNKEDYERDIQIIKPASAANHFHFTVPALTSDVKPTHVTNDRPRGNHTARPAPLFSQPARDVVTCWRCYTVGHYATECPQNEHGKPYNQSSVNALNPRSKYSNSAFPQRPKNQ